MKLNGDQRIVMQALLDGKGVKYRHDGGAIWYALSLDKFKFVGEPDIEYRIEEPPIKVALFKHDDGNIGTGMYGNEFFEGKGWIRISDWVEIVPTRSDE